MRGPSIKQSDAKTVDRLTVTVEEPYCTQLRQLARSRGIGVSPLVREIIIRELNQISETLAASEEFEVLSVKRKIG